MNILKRLLIKIRNRTAFTSILQKSNKYNSEKTFWENELISYINWYNGDIPELYGEPSPKTNKKIVTSNIKDSAILTWGRTHQQAKYLQDLDLTKEAFIGKKLLDIGAGPYPSASIFEDCEIFCLDPLLPSYLEIGFPLHYYDHVKFINAKAENIPLSDHYIDAIISVNALDHVDSFLQTVNEMNRVLKPKGKIRLHLHYHKGTMAEPIELNDIYVKEAFSWCADFKKIRESKTKRGHRLEDINEDYTVWSNF